MREEVQRISKLVADGKLSPEDAASLIDAFYESDRIEEAENAGAVPPPPPPTEDVKKSARDPFKSLVESIEKMTKEGLETVDWTEVSKHARQSAKKGLDHLKSGIEDLSKGKVNMAWLLTSEEREVTLPLTLPNGKTLKIENRSGEVKVVGGFDVGSVSAHARFRGSTSDEAKAKADAYTLIIEESDHIVEIRQPDVNGLTVDIEVQLPGHGNVNVTSESGNIQLVDTQGSSRIEGKSGNVTLRGLHGIVEVVTASGNVSVEDTEGASLSLENRSGNIRAARIKGNLKARTASGDITVTNSSGKVISLETASGNVTVDLDEPVTGTLNVRTVEGDTLAAIPDGSDCRVSLSTLRGSVSTGIELHDRAGSESRVTGRIGEGNGSLDISAVSGNITIELRDQVS